MSDGRFEIAEAGWCVCVRVRACVRTSSSTSHHSYHSVRYQRHCVTVLIQMISFRTV